MRGVGLRARRLAAVAVVAAVGAEPAAARTYAERVSETILPNGLKLILLEDHKAPVVVFQIYYRVGSRNEALGHTGLSHILEHVMFKGTDKVGPEEYSKIIQRNGGRTNAWTTEDNTTYFATMASDRVGVMIDLEADRMTNLKLTDEVFLPERSVIMEERRLRVDNNPVADLFEQLSSTAYSAHPYEFPVIGWMSDIAQATLADALQHYRTYYIPNNAFVVAVGDFDTTALTAQIGEAFGSDRRAARRHRPVRAIEPAQHGARRVELKREAQLPFVAMAHHVPNLRSGDAAALEVLAAILSGGDSARLHQAARLSPAPRARRRRQLRLHGDRSRAVHGLRAAAAGAVGRRRRSGAGARARAGGEPPRRARASSKRRRTASSRSSSSPRTRSSTRRCCSGSTRSPVTGGASTTICPRSARSPPTTSCASLAPTCGPRTAPPPCSFPTRPCRGRPGPTRLPRAAIH